MTIEEKAQAYDEALLKARMYHDNAKSVEDYVAVARYENIFKELRESEDERIKRTLDDVSRLLIMLNYKETAMNHKQAVEQLISMLQQKREDLPKWLVDEDYDEKVDGKDFSLHSVGLAHRGYYIPYSDLLKLPKEDEK